MKTFVMDVTTRVEITFDEAKFTPQVMEDFNRCISDFGTGGHAFPEHAEHIAQLVARGIIEGQPSEFVEGYGPLSNVGVKVFVDEQYTYVERQFPQEGGAA